MFDTIDLMQRAISAPKRDILGAFCREASDKRVKVLSGGERSRLAMIRLLLEPVNLLIMDEPTNHLDMASKDVLKKAIEAFEGTAIIVSHDRDFLNGLVEKVYEFGGGRVREHLGGIYEFLEKRKLESHRSLNEPPPSGSDNGVKEKSREPISESKRSIESESGTEVRKLNGMSRGGGKSERLEKITIRKSSPPEAADMEHAEVLPERFKNWTAQ